MSHESENFVTHNPFEGKNGAVTENDLRFSLEGVYCFDNLLCINVCNCSSY